jgi:hypothetical protein
MDDGTASLALFFMFAVAVAMIVNGLRHKETRVFWIVYTCFLGAMSGFVTWSFLFPSAFHTGWVAVGFPDSESFNINTDLPTFPWTAKALFGVGAVVFFGTIILSVLGFLLTVSPSVNKTVDK